MDYTADAIDSAILKELQKDSRRSFADIARSVQRSPSAVRERIVRMEDMGVIKKYSLEIDHSKLGYDLEAFVLVKVFHGKLNPFLKKIPMLGEVRQAYRITGNQNVHLKVVLRNQLHLQQFIDDLMPYGDTHTLLILSNALAQ